MKALLVGLGAMGVGWLKKLENADDMAIAVVEPNESRQSLLDGKTGIPFYRSLTEAIEREKPDFLVNVTPPFVHSQVNHTAFDYRLPVLCEKPISFDYEESQQVVRRAIEENIPFMVAENYRRHPYVRKLKQLLDEGAIGELSAIDAVFYRYHERERAYPVSLLKDIAVHHLDMIRYLTGQEGKRIFARNVNPRGSWDRELVSVNLYVWLETEGGIPVTYTGSLAARSSETPWSGNWRVEGTEGAIELVDKELTLFTKSGAAKVDMAGDPPVTDCLGEFLASLREGREAETSGQQYLRTEALMYYAERSSEAASILDIQLPDLGRNRS